MRKKLIKKAKKQSMGIYVSHIKPMKRNVFINGFLIGFLAGVVSYIILLSLIFN